MGFSGARALVLAAIFVLLVWGVTKFDLPGWFIAVGIVAAGAALKGWENRASAAS
ncbi:MAG TPA: hypothetical protein VGR00_09960 [Thermoanaerobaculia bacterium]|nr:hypothetical protein [Thermoanaerobaculia bacterium]